MNLNLKDKVAIITGGANGIGKGIVAEFAQEGSDIVIADLNYDLSVKTKRELESLGRNVTALKVDVRKRNSVQQMVERILEPSVESIS